MQNLGIFPAPECSGIRVFAQLPISFTRFGNSPPAVQRSGMKRYNIFMVRAPERLIRAARYQASLKVRIPELTNTAST